MVCLGAEHHPVDRTKLRRVRDGAEREVDNAVVPVEGQPLNRPPGTGDDVVPVRRSERTRKSGTDAAEANDGDGLACWFGGCWGHGGMVRQSVD
jgi:hypothetical protein